MTRPRDLGLDAARGVALLSMFVAHFAPVPGPASILTLSEHLTAFMFVLLIGCGAELGRDSPGRWRSSQVRGSALVVLGLLLMQLPSGILVILVWLGVMTVLATWLAQLPTWAVVTVGAVSLLAAPEVMERSRVWLLEMPRDPITVAATEVLASGQSYRVVGFVVPACAGVLLARHGRSDRARWTAASGCLPVVVALFALDQAGIVAVEAYTGTHAEIAFDTALAVMVTGVVWTITPRVALAGRLLAATGSVALTAYCLQVVGDWAYLRSGAVTDDRWSVLAVACTGALTLGAVWRPVDRLTGWRGPVEGVVDRLARRGGLPGTRRLHDLAASAD